MNLVGRLQVDACLRQLRSTTNPSEGQRSEWRARLLSHGAAAIPRLIDTLPQKSVRQFALGVLSELLNDDTLSLFTAALGSPDGAIAGGVCEVLGSGQHYNPSRLLDLLHDPGVPKARLEGVLSTQMVRIPPRTLVPMLSELDKEPRAIVFRLLEARADTDAILEALPLTSDPDWSVRLSMVRLLALVPAEPAVQSIIRLLADPNKSVRLEATRSLARLKAPAAIGPLCELLRDTDLRIQTGAIDALIAANDQSAVPHLVEVLKDESEKTRRAAVEVLNAVVTVEAIKDLVMALRDEDWWVRARAADALGSLGGPKVIEAVVELIGDADSFVRRYAVEILNTVSSERAVEPLVAALNDDDWWVRERAIDALARIGDPRAVEPLLELLTRDSEAVSLVTRALGELGDARAVPALDRLTRSQDHEVRGRAVQALQALLKKDLSVADREQVIQCLRDVGAEGLGRSGPISHIRAHGGAAEPGRGGYGSSKGRSIEESEPVPVPESPPQTPRINFQDIPIGTLLIERYRIMRRVGGGGFGTVYLVKDVLVGEESILKILSPQFSHDPDMIRRFVQELRLTRRITHSSVIRIHEILDLGETHAISMEYFPSHDLARILKTNGTTPPARLVPLAVQVCEALQAAHDLGIIHRDVKPANILVGLNDQVKVVDFGLAAVGMQLGSRLTKSGLMIGTPEYMSPEQITGHAVDARSDIYSLGIVLYEALSGVGPFAGESTVNVLFRHVEGGARPLHEVTTNVPEELDRLVMKAMAREPADRFESAGEFRQRLLDLAGPASHERDVA